MSEKKVEVAKPNKNTVLDRAWHVHRVDCFIDERAFRHQGMTRATAFITRTLFQLLGDEWYNQWSRGTPVRLQCFPVHAFPIIRFGGL